MKTAEGSKNEFELHKKRVESAKCNICLMKGYNDEILIIRMSRLFRIFNCSRTQTFHRSPTPHKYYSSFKTSSEINRSTSDRFMLVTQGDFLLSSPGLLWPTIEPSVSSSRTSQCTRRGVPATAASAKQRIDTSPTESLDLSHAPVYLQTCVKGIRHI